MDTQLHMIWRYAACDSSSRIASRALSYRLEKQQVNKDKFETWCRYVADEKFSMLVNIGATLGVQALMFHQASSGGVL